MMPLSADPFGMDEPKLMLEINTTPLIDVLLVLLVMLIITIPVQLHAVNTALPVRAPAAVPLAASLPAIDIHIDAADRIMWQGEAVDRVELQRRMAALTLLAAPPALHVRPDRACSYAVFAHVLATSRRHGLNRVAVLGNEQFR